MDSRTRAPELLRDLGDHIASQLVTRLSLQPEQAAAIGDEVATSMASVWGGQLLYFPKGTGVILSRRDMEIWNAFNGRNHSELAQQYNVSLQWVYKIVKTMRETDLKLRQGALFADELDDSDS